MSCGSRIRARAIATRCCSPRDSALARQLAMAEADLVGEASLPARPRHGAFAMIEAGRQQYIFKHAELRQELEILKHQSHSVTAPAIALRRR